MSSHFRLFVYGTLRSNAAGASLLAAGEQIGEGSVGGVLYDMDGAYPALVLYGAAPIRGEVWKLPAAALATLDAYEGIADGLFRRVGVEVVMDDGSISGCWVYVAGPRLGRLLTPERRVESAGI